MKTTIATILLIATNAFCQTQTEINYNQLRADARRNQLQADAVARYREQQNMIINQQTQRAQPTVLINRYTGQTIVIYPK